MTTTYNYDPNINSMENCDFYFLNSRKGEPVIQKTRDGKAINTDTVVRGVMLVMLAPFSIR